MRFYQAKEFVENLFSWQLLGADLTKYPNIISWYERCKELPSCAESLEGAKVFADKVKSIWQDKLWTMAQADL